MSISKVNKVHSLFNQPPTYFRSFTVFGSNTGYLFISLGCVLYFIITTLTNHWCIKYLSWSCPNFSKQNPISYIFVWFQIHTFDCIVTLPWHEMSHCYLIISWTLASYFVWSFGFFICHTDGNPHIVKLYRNIEHACVVLILFCIIQLFTKWYATFLLHTFPMFHDPLTWCMNEVMNVFWHE